MFSKISTVEIIQDHLSTLRRDEKLSFIDILTFYIVPLIIGIASYIFDISLDTKSTSTLVTVGSIFTGLLLSLMILIYDQRSKLENEHSDKATKFKTALLQLLNNISYAILISVFLVAIAFIEQVFSAIPEFRKVLDGILISLAVHLALTILMVLKRVNIAVTSRF